MQRLKLGYDNICARKLLVIAFQIKDLLNLIIRGTYSFFPFFFLSIEPLQWQIAYYQSLQWQATYHQSLQWQATYRQSLQCQATYYQTLQWQATYYQSLQWQATYYQSLHCKLHAICHWQTTDERNYLLRWHCTLSSMWD